jgi:nucleoprotein TPR
MSDRQRMHEDQFRVHNLEIDEFSKRNAQLNEQNVRLDIEGGRLNDELQVALSRLEQLRNDCANLRAEKKIWEVSETGSIAI